MKRLVLIVFLVALCLASCGGKKHNSGPPKPANYDAPVWHVDLIVKDGIDAPTAIEFETRLNQTTQLWLDYWKQQSNGFYRPPGIPRGPMTVQIVVERNCSNSGESEGIGSFGMKIKGQRCDGKRIEHDLMLSWACHRFGHLFSGTGSAGNSAHTFIQSITGC